MDLKQYTQDAIRTESQIDNVKINGRMLINVLALYISAGQMLDQIKKHVFYGKDYNGDDINSAWLTARDAIEGINGVPITEPLREDTLEIDPRIFHSIVGIATESTELCEALYDALLHRKELDIVNLLEELGDLVWYSSLLVDNADGSWDEILDTNIAKLKKRYPEKFTNDNAINRNLNEERQVLEEGLKQD